MATLIYKRTHSGDPDSATGVFGCANCMGCVRGWTYDAVIGVGGIGKEPQDNRIAGLLTWIGIGAHRSGDLRRPLVTFDHFLYYGENGEPLHKVAPHLATRIYGNNVRMIKDASLNDAERRDVVAILRRARNAPPSGGVSARKRIEQTKCGTGKC